MFWNKSKDPPKKINTDDFSDYKIGDIGPISGKPIKYIIFQSKTFIVFLDHQSSIFYYTNEAYGAYPETWGEAINEVILLDNWLDQFFNKRDIIRYKTMLAGALARALEEKTGQSAKQILSALHEKIKTVGNEKLRLAYLKSSLFTTVIVLILIIVIWLNRHSLEQFLNKAVLYGAINALAGALGAFVSTIIKSREYITNIDVSKFTHSLDGFLRIFYGIIGGLIIYTGIKSNLILGFIGQANTFLMFFLCAVAGVSEILLPNIVKEAESKFHLKETIQTETDIKA